MSDKITIIQLHSRIKTLEHEVRELEDDLNLADEMHTDAEAASSCANFWLVGVIVFLVMWIATG